MQYILEPFLPHELMAALSAAAPEDRPPFATAEATGGAEGAGVEAAAAEETGGDANRSADSISAREKRREEKRNARQRQQTRSQGLQDPTHPGSTDLSSRQELHIPALHLAKTQQL